MSNLVTQQRSCSMFFQDISSNKRKVLIFEILWISFLFFLAGCGGSSNNDDLSEQGETYLTKAREQYEAIDTNNDGVLSNEELSAFVDSGFDSLDADADGDFDRNDYNMTPDSFEGDVNQDKRISEREFIDATLAHFKANHDLDESGSISIDEAMEAQTRLFEDFEDR